MSRRVATLGKRLHRKKDKRCKKQVGSVKYHSLSLSRVSPNFIGDKLPLSPRRKKNLMDMCQYIPAEFRGFYESLSVQ
jgi:hypothetical protein